MWLSRLGAIMRGLSLPGDRLDDLFFTADIASLLDDQRGDIRDTEKLAKITQEFEPEVVIHLAAQSLVRRSYAEPHTTFATNVMGTVNLLEAVRATPSVRAVVIVTSDKCYENDGSGHPFAEDSPLGGVDPYSASKAGAELVAKSYRHLISSIDSRDSVLIATARAGNVIGGGDWSEDRLLPDLARGMRLNRSVSIRYPSATRPWQHVLDPLNGYLMLAERLFAGEANAARAWNFGPTSNEVLTVQSVVETCVRFWAGRPKVVMNRDAIPYEAPLLALDATRAVEDLGWAPRWTQGEAVEHTAAWYALVPPNADLGEVRAACARDLDEFGRARTDGRDS
jgi:CDP-glucose 4,6-dehydratase